jgi:Protein of unknown function (DUF1553)/Protein of unknown function (DUF1549)/Planctomycete cytochrome C
MRFRFLLIPAFTVLAGAAESALPEQVRFNRDIRPIMAGTCFHCHGPDATSREAGLRLDIREEALKKTKNDFFPIVPGDAEKSEIIARIFDAEDPMPPTKAHKTLAPRQKALMRRWVEQGAAYEPHWAYAPLQRPALPAGRANAHPIDAFIQARLAEQASDLSPEAPVARLLRRVSLDLTGLPPTPAELAAISGGTDSAAYTRAVDRLLASPRFGERMAVGWLDVARFADTVGFHGDQNQRIFPYRDYVINAFNTNKRFDQFTIEQIAGDLLPNPTTEQLVATGYNRLNMMTREGGAQPKEYLAKYGAERVRSVAAAWFGSTLGCAECHDHKFDPIKTRDFYELQSFFADVKQWGVYANYGYTPEPELIGVDNDSPFPPEIAVESPYLKKAYERAQRALEEKLRVGRAAWSQDASAGAARATWELATRDFLSANPDGWVRVTPVVTAPVKTAKASSKNKGKNAGDLEKPAALVTDGAVQLAAPLGKGELLKVTLVAPDLRRLAALRIEVGGEADGGAPLGKAVSISLGVAGADGKVRKIAFGPGEATGKRSIFKGGAEVFGLGGEWRLPPAGSAGPLQATWLLDRPVELAAEETFQVMLGGDNTRPLRFSLSALGSVDPAEVAGGSLLAALALPDNQRSLAQKALVLDAWQMSTVADEGAFEATRKLFAAVRDLDRGRAWSLVTQAAVPLTVRVLPRGNWQDESGPVVTPATPSFLPGRRESSAEARLTRLDLARWIVSAENPITARAVMNRFWQQFFGTGLSATVDDLGSQGEPPSHPELLEWLASEFRESGWDVKHMMRLIVTSRTYRQNSRLRPEFREIDPANRLLSSQNPRRLEAEFVRDNALFIAGALNVADVGGPSVQPYQPSGYYDALQFPNRNYIASLGAAQQRRGVYVHWQRTFLHPMLANFDAPSRDECAALRTVSNTPQQALTLLNDPTFVEAARLFAGRLLGDPAVATDAPRIRLAYQLAMAREPQPRETTALLAFLKNQRDYYHAHPDDAQKISGKNVAASAAPAWAEWGAWINLCRVVLNTQETFTRY